MLRKLRKMTGARASPLAMSVASTRKNARVTLKLNSIVTLFRAPRSWQAGTLALQSVA